MLIRLIYASTANDTVDIHEFKRILLQAKANNNRCDLTGMLAFNSKIFLQALEGDRNQVSELYGRLMRDPRHHSLAVLKAGDIEQRMWSQWSMGFAAPNADNRALFLKHSSQSTFNPYFMRADAVEQMLLELSATVIAMKPQAQAAEPHNEGGIFARFLKK
jgi:hypothetical protein